jgi:16S rRNA (cytosine967-C5)-methyltransferase
MSCREKMPFDARKAALETLNTLDRGQSTLDNLLDAVTPEDTAISRRDRAFFQALVFGVLRWRGRLDFIINQYSKTRFEKIDPRVLNILRLALFQIIYLDRVPESAAVNTAVELAKATVAPWVVGYVNAVLRKATKNYQNLAFPTDDKDAISAIATTKSFPEWIIRRWMARYGLKDTAALCDDLNTIPTISIRTNRLKASRHHLTQSLAGEVEQIKSTVYSPDGITFVHPATAIPGLSAFKAGWFQVQDEAAQLVSLLLNPQPGETVMDACAGFGGKTGHIAQLMQNRGSIVALDIHAGKLSRLKTEMQRLGITIVNTLCGDLEKIDLQQQLESFDRILLDAPCSGLGVMRRNPDIKWRISKKNLAPLIKKQQAFLHNLSLLVKPSGVLVYAVCSPEPEENEYVVNEFLKKHHEFVIDKQVKAIPNQMCSIESSDGWYKTFPRFSHMDGFSFVRLKRN